MYRTDDPIADFNRWDEEQAAFEERLPRCEYCGEACYETYYEINGEIICEECIESFRHDVDTYID